jgi:hypothetical protein
MRAPVLAAALICALMAAPGSAIAQPSSGAVCTPPGPTPADSERPAPLPPKPVMPGCIDPHTLRGHCPDQVADAYSAQVTAYNDAVRVRSAGGQAFADHLRAWATQVQAYGQCEINLLNAGN